MGTKFKEALRETLWMALLSSGFFYVGLELDVGAMRVAGFLGVLIFFRTLLRRV